MGVGCSGWCTTHRQYTSRKVTDEPLEVKVRTLHTIMNWEVTSLSLGSQTDLRTSHIHNFSVWVRTDGGVRRRVYVGSVVVGIPEYNKDRDSCLGSLIGGYV